MMNFLILVVNAIHDAIELTYVHDNAILKWFMSKIYEIRHIPGTFQWNWNNY